MANRMARNWARMTDQVTVVASGANSQGDLLQDYKTEVGINEVRGKTIGTIIGEAVIHPSAIITGASLGRWAMGIGVFPKGVVNVVVGQDSWPWMWYWETSFKPRAFEESAGVFNVESVTRSFHIRSMRKLQTNQDLQLVVHNFAAANANMGVSGNILLLG